MNPLGIGGTGLALTSQARSKNEEQVRWCVDSLLPPPCRLNVGNEVFGDSWCSKAGESRSDGTVRQNELETGQGWSRSLSV